MRRLIKRLDGRGKDSQHGATAVITAILMVVLLAFAAIAVDVGMMYSEKAQLQNGADAAALAIAENCASDAGCGTYSATAATMAKSNANDNAANVSSIDLQLAARTVTVNVSSKNAGGGSFINLVFANVFGQDKATIQASATAVWPAPDSLVAIPWTIGDCQFKATLNQAQKDAVRDGTTFPVDPSKTPLFMRSDTNASYPGCTAGAGYANGGFGWLEPQDTVCLSIPKLPPYVLPGYPGNSSGKVLDDPACTGLLNSLLNADSYIPIFSSSWESGQNARYTLSGFAIFHVTGWNFTPETHDGANPPACLPNGNRCRGFFGYFKGYVEIQDYLALQPESDDKTVRLIK